MSPHGSCTCAYQVFYYRSNCSPERVEEFIQEYRKQNGQTGGPNFHKSGFSYGGGAGHAERNVILRKNLLTWPVDHARREGWLEHIDDFLKLVCLMFEEGSYELGLELVEKGSNLAARMQAAHRLNLNCGLAATTALCGTPSFEEARASFLITFRAPWRLSSRIANSMDRAEWKNYVRSRHIPTCFDAMTRTTGRLDCRSSMHGTGFSVSDAL